MPARIRRPSPGNRVALEITIAELARACDWTPKTALRRLIAADVPLRRRGAGTKRAHWALSVADLVASELGWVKTAIDWRKLMLAQAPAGGEDDGEDAD